MGVELSVGIGGSVCFIFPCSSGEEELEGRADSADIRLLPHFYLLSVNNGSCMLAND